MPERQQPTRDEIEALPHSEVISFRPFQNSVIINGEIGIGFGYEHDIFFVCDKRITIQRSGMKKRPSKRQPAEIGLLNLHIVEGGIIFVGNDFPLVIERISPANSEPKIKISHTEEFVIEHTNLSSDQLRQKLEANLVSHSTSL